MRHLLLSILLFTAMPCRAQEGNIAISGPFKGVNNTDASVTLEDGKAQDLLNVEATQDGLGITLRRGYSLFQDVTIATAGIKGAKYFRDSSGNNIKLFANDRFVYKTTNNGTFATVLATATIGSDWMFCESGGYIYGFNSNNDRPWRYDGTTRTDLTTSPLGTMCSTTLDRLLVAGTTDYPNRLYYSASGDYTNFTVGTDPEDPSYEEIGLPGEKITAILATNTEWLVWKTNSLVSFQGTNQYDLVAYIISDQIGVINPTDVVELDGIVYFKGSDNKIYAYAGGRIQEISKEITSWLSVLASGMATVTETVDSEAEFEAGTLGESWDSNRISGSIINSSWTAVDTSSANFAAGTLVNVSTAVAGQISVYNSSSAVFINAGGEASSSVNWTFAHSGSGVGDLSRSTAFKCFGTYGLGEWNNVTACTMVLYVKNAADDSVLYTSPNLCTATFDTCTSYVVPLATQPASMIYINVRRGYNPTSIAYMTSANFIKPKQLEFSGFTHYDGYNHSGFDINEALIQTTSGTFTSQVFDTAFSTPTWGIFNATVSSGTDSGLTFQVQSSSYSTGGFQTAVSQSLATNIAAGKKRYVKYIGNFTHTVATATPASISDVTLEATSTDTYVSETFTLSEPSSLGICGADYTAGGGAAATTNIRCDNVSTALSTTAWTAFTNNTVPAVATKTYCQLGVIDTLTSATDTLRVDNLAFRYNTGATPARTYAFKYDKDIFFTVPYGQTQTTNNRLLKLDLQTGGWWIWDIAMNTPIDDNKYLYFGNPSTGHTYYYPSGYTDNGSAITSYWQDKDHSGNNIYKEKKFNKISTIFGSNSGTSLDVTYQINTSSAITYAVNLTDSKTYVNNNRSLNIDSILGNYINLKFSNSTVNQPWKFYGANIEYVEKPWRVLP